MLEGAGMSEFAALTRNHGAAQSPAARARLVPAAADGLKNNQIAAKVGVSATAGAWRSRFSQRRIEADYEEPGPGAPRATGDEEIAATIRKTLEVSQRRHIAKEIGHAPSTAHRICRAFGLQPHRVGTFKLPSDPLFVHEVRNIVGLCSAPASQQTHGMNRTSGHQEHGHARSIQEADC